MKQEEYSNIDSKEKISLPILFFGLFILFTFYSNNRYWGITEYYFFPLMIIGSSIMFFMKYYKTIKVNLEHVCMLFLIYLLVYKLLSFGTNIDRGVYLSYILFMIMFLLITQIKVNKREIRYLVNSYIISALIISLLIIIFRRELDGWVGTYRYTLKFYNHVYIDPNYISAFINIAVVFSLNRVFYHRDKVMKAVYLAITLLISGAVFLTGSRAGIIALFLCYGVVLAINLKIKSAFIGLFCMVSLAVLVILYLPDEMTQRVFNISSYLETNQTRIMNWIHGIEAFLERPVLGYGIMESQNILKTYFGYSRAVHNTYLAFLIHFGMVGTFFMAVIFLNILIKIFKSKLRVMTATLLSLLFTSIMIENNITLTFWIVLILNYLVYDFANRHPDIPIEEVI